MSVAVFKNLPSYHLPDVVASGTQGAGEMELWMVLTRREWEDPSLMTFLEKILTAIHRKKDHSFYLIVDTPFYIHKYLEKHELNKIIICFGVPSSGLGMNASEKMNEWDLIRGHHFLFTDALVVLNRDEVRKKHFWLALQRKFLK